MPRRSSRRRGGASSSSSQPRTKTFKSGSRSPGAEIGIREGKGSFDDKVAEKLAAERGRIVAEEAQKAKLRAADDFNAKVKELAELQDL